MSDTGAHVLLVVIDLRIAYAQSLKDKRRIVKSLKDRLSSRFNISIAELSELDNCKQSVLGMTMISNDRAYLEKQLSHIQTLILEVRDIDVIKVTKEWL